MMTDPVQNEKPYHSLKLFFLIYIFDAVTVTLSLQHYLFREATLETAHRVVYL